MKLAVAGKVQSVVAAAEASRSALMSRSAPLPSGPAARAIVALVRDCQERVADVPGLLRDIGHQRQALLSVLLTELYSKAPGAGERLRKRLPALPWPEIADRDVPDIALVTLAEFEALEDTKQIATARNVALLWDCFVEEFDGVSGFLSATATEQNDYLEKLDSAARRMEPGRFSAVGYHYVSVVLMKLYVSFLHGNDSGPSAIALSRRVSMLINDGRAIRAKESKSPIIVLATPDSGTPAPVLEPRTQVEVEQQPPRFAPFRIGYVSQPEMRTAMTIRSN
jgi:hypothetical protein